MNIFDVSQGNVKYDNFNIDFTEPFEEQEENYWKGHTSNYLVVKKEGKNLENMLQTVKIASVDKLYLVGAGLDQTVK